MKKAFLWAFVCVLLLTAPLGCGKTPKIDEPQVHSLEEVRQELQQDKGQYPQDYIHTLRKKFPQYFDLGDFKGLEVYAWLSDGAYYCGVLSGTNRLKTLEELNGLKSNGATVEEMKAILSSYDMPRENIAVLPIDSFIQALSTPPVNNQ